MIRIETYPTVEGNGIVIGMSAALFRVIGAGVFRPRLIHRVVKYYNGRIILVAEFAVVTISEEPRTISEPDYDGGMLAIGERMIVDQTEYEIRARVCADPELVEVRIA